MKRVHSFTLGKENKENKNSGTQPLFPPPRALSHSDMYNLRCVKTSFGYSKISVTSTSCQKEAGFHHFHGNDADFCPFDDLALPTPGVRQRGVGAGDGMLQENWNPDKTGKYQKLMRQSGRQRTGRASCPEGIWSKEQNYKVGYKPGLDAPHSEGRKTHPIKAKQRNLLSAWSKEHHRCAQHLPPPGAGLLPPNSTLELNSGVSPGVLPEMGTTCLQLVLGWDVKQRKYSNFSLTNLSFLHPQHLWGVFCPWLCCNLVPSATALLTCCKVTALVPNTSAPSKQVLLSSGSSARVNTSHYHYFLLITTRKFIYCHFVPLQPGYAGNHSSLPFPKYKISPAIVGMSLIFLF